jgi:hypothetical protein
MRKLDKQIQVRKKHWLAHLRRMPPERAPKQHLHYETTGSCDPGRPRRRWLGVGGWNGLMSSTLGDDDDD